MPAKKAGAISISDWPGSLWSGSYSLATHHIDPSPTGLADSTRDCEGVVA